MAFTMRATMALLAVLGFACTTATTERERNFPDLYKYPLHGRGDPLLSFHHPFEPDEDGDPVSGWVQLGSTMVTSNPHGREIIRLTTTAQANQGLFYAYTKTRTNDFNGWFDLQIDTSPDSHEPADGMGLFFTSQRPVIGSAMGMSHTIPGLGLIIDTFSNSRTRMTPYLYAYVSDGNRAWNPDTDGADTELTKGCHLELNKPIRIFVKFVDGKLDVGVSFTPHSPEHWHSCFSVDHVHLPFNDGGYLTFAGETGHFFAAHDILSASFVAEHAHNKRPDEYARELEERRKREQEAASAHDHYHHYQEQDRQKRENDHYERREREDRERREREEKERRDRERHERHATGGSGKETMAENLDRQVSDVFASISDHMRGFNSKDAEDTKQRLDGVREMTAHILKEVGRQRNEVKHVVDTMASLKEASNSMAYATGKFKSSLSSMHKSVETLRERTNDMADTHMELQEKMDHHHDTITRNGGGDGHGFFILFFTLQIIIAAVFVVSNKMVSANRKMGRMV